MNLALKSRIFRRKFEEYALSTKIGRELLNNVYPSMHFFERSVERGFETKLNDLFVSCCVAYKFFKETTFEQRNIAVTICGKYVSFEITIRKQTGRRVLVMKTIYEIDDVRKYQFDEVL